MIQTHIIRHIKSWFLAATFAVFVGGTAVNTVASQLTSAAPVAAPTVYTCASAKGFLTFPVWYRGLTKSDVDCDLTSPDAVGGIGNFIWRIALNVIDIGLQLVGYIAAGFVLYGGVLFLRSAGDPAKTARARTMILDAMIGLVISIGSVAIINVFTGIVK